MRLSGGITAALLSSVSNKICLILGLQCQIVGFILDFTRMQAVSRAVQCAKRDERAEGSAVCGLIAVLLIKLAYKLTLPAGLQTINVALAALLLLYLFLL